ncbi:vacuolar transporter chaperone [Linnemannia zychae]|nr:vacuolar transporter chaperone [Linnemannia zychae]
MAALNRPSSGDKSDNSASFVSSPPTIPSRFSSYRPPPLHPVNPYSGQGGFQQPLSPRQPLSPTQPLSPVRPLSPIHPYPQQQQQFQQRQFQPQGQYQPQSQYQPQAQYQPQSQYQPRSQYQPQSQYRGPPSSQQQQQQQPSQVQSSQSSPAPGYRPQNPPAQYNRAQSPPRQQRFDRAQSPPRQYNNRAQSPPRSDIRNNQINAPSLASAFSTNNNNNSNNYRGQYPLIPGPPSPPTHQSPSTFAQTSSAQTPSVKLAAPTPSRHHPLAVEEIHLNPPQRSFLSETPDRPLSVASFSNLSTHSNEPLNQPEQQDRSPRPRNVKKLSTKKMSFRGGNNASSGPRPMTPQLWHPENNRSTNTSESALDEIDNDDRRRHKEDENQPKLKKKRKNLMARIRSFRKPDPIYKVKRTGRLAQFSNERLYLHWIRFGILQAGIAVTLLNFGNQVAGIIGVLSLILALLTLVYATTLYHLRHIYMITKRKDVVYFARRIPTLLCLGLFCVYLADFILVYTIGSDMPVKAPWDDPYSFNKVF